MEGKAALWTLVGIFVVFKVATTAMILIAAPEAANTIVGMFIAFHWPFVIAGILFGVTPGLFWWRLIRVRAKRARLQEAEWRVDPSVHPPIMPR
jgi:hypothetical protein